MLKFITFLITAVTAISNFFGIGMNIKVTPTPLQRVNGFGTSACWWAQMTDEEETREYLAKELFSEEGLGLNIYRYNVGAGVNPEKNRIGEISRRTESFYYYNEESGKYEYDFSRDANSMAMLKKALSYGCIDTVVLFANSPHYSMTVNGEPAGSESGGVSNLREDKYDDFADYFLTITEHFLEEGIPVKYISPVNEPQWDWGGSWVGQEGCHYDTQQLIRLYEIFAKEIDRRKLDVKLMVPESGEIGDRTLEYFDALQNNKTIAPKIGSLAYHSYWSDEGMRRKLNLGLKRDRKIKGPTYDMTEWCELPCNYDVEDIDAALLMARVIANDFYFENCNSWSNWVAVNTSSKRDGKYYSDGLFYSLDPNYDEIKPTIRYTAFAHFAKFVPPGSKILMAYSNLMDKSSDDKNNFYYKTSFAAFRTPDCKRVIVIVNEDGEKKIGINAGLFSKMTIYTTDAERRLEKTYEGRMKLRVTVGEKSITTIVLK